MKCKNILKQAGRGVLESFPALDASNSDGPYSLFDIQLGEFRKGGPGLDYIGFR